MYLRVDVGAASLASDVADPQKHEKTSKCVTIQMCYHLVVLRQTVLAYVVGLKIGGRASCPPPLDGAWLSP